MNTVAKKMLYLVAVLFTGFILQCTLLGKLSIGHVRPNILLIFSCLGGFYLGKKRGLFFGFFAGLMLDIFFGTMIGFYAFLYMMIGYGNGLLAELFLLEKLKIPVVQLTVSELIYGFTMYFFQYLLRGRFHFFYYLGHIMIPELLYTTLVLCLFYPLLKKLINLYKTLDQRSDSSLGKTN